MAWPWPLPKERIPSSSFLEPFPPIYFFPRPPAYSILQVCLYIADFHLYRLLPIATLISYWCHEALFVKYTYYKMGRKKDPAEFLKRAQQKGSEKNKIHINSSIVQSHLEPQTRQAYQRQVDNWYQLVASFLSHITLELIIRFAKAKYNTSTSDLEPPEEFVQSLTNDLESLKEFVQNIAFDIDGLEANEDPTKNSTLMQQ